MGIRLIQENIVRQNKAMLLLSALLEEEFSRLKARNAEGVSQIEISIQELLRQFASERSSLRAAVGRVLPGATRVKELAEHVEKETFDVLMALLQRLDDTEQACSRQAAKNHALVLALHDQSRKLLEFMHNEIQPKGRDSYSARGRFVAASAQGNILRGRL